MKLKLSVLLIILSLATITMPILKNGLVHAEDRKLAGEICTYLKKWMSNMKSTDYALVNIQMEWDAVADTNEAAELTEKDIEEVNSEVQRREQAAWEEFRKEARWSTEELCEARDNNVIRSYAELLKLYGADWESKNLLQKGINEPWEDIKARLQKEIEVIPDTRVIYIVFKDAGPVLVVGTKVCHVYALAEIPGVMYICENTYGTIVDGKNTHVALLYPPINLIDCRIDKSTFMWLPHEDATTYRFMLAKDVAITQIVEDARVNGTTYVFYGTLEYGNNYFWRVMALEPAPSDWSATFSFQTEAAPPTTAGSQSQPISWNPMLIWIIIVALAAGGGLVTWLVIAKRNRAKQ